MDGQRLLTDPVLVQRVAHLRRHSAPVGDVGPVDAVLLSHAHHDHLDLRSLRRLGTATRIVAPAGVGAMLRGKGFGAAGELEEGATADVGGVAVRALHARHRSRRIPLGRETPTLGYRVEGTSSVVFFGDTDVFEGMTALGPPPDVALLPVWGWGPTLGPGHLDPGRAAQAVELLRPRVAIPIHWGSFAPAHMSAERIPFLKSPGPDFAAHVARTAPEVEVRVLAPGEATEVAG